LGVEVDFLARQIAKAIEFPAARRCAIRRETDLVNR
jgi:hypothetical protein